jgi:hypothetical protein
MGLAQFLCGVALAPTASIQATADFSPPHRVTFPAERTQITGQLQPLFRGEHGHGSFQFCDTHICSQ